MTHRRRVLPLVLLAAAAVAGGCNAFRESPTRRNAGTQRPTPVVVDGEAVEVAGTPVVVGRPTREEGPVVDIDQGDNLNTDRGGLLPVEGLAVDRPTADPAAAAREATPELEPVPGRRSVPDLAAAPEEDDGERVIPVDDGQAMPVGGVIARVNGEPIYTDAVLQAVRPVLRARARTLARDRYAAAAREEIAGQLRQVVADRLALEGARAKLSDREKLLAQNRATAWREEQIITAGGSVAVADAKARELGFTSFDEMTERKYEELLVRTFYDRRIRPRVTVTAGEMRRRYGRDRDERFSDKESATFRLIRVSDEAQGGEAAAKAKAEEVKAKLDAGLEFVQAAATHNDDETLAASGGALASGSMTRGTYRDEEVEDAIYAAEVGQVVGPVRVDSQRSFYLALVEDKAGGSTRGFGDPDVQEELRRLIAQEKYARLIAELDAERRREAVVAEVPGAVETAIDIALHDYDVWAAESRDESRTDAGS